MLTAVWRLGQLSYTLTNHCRGLFFDFLFTKSSTLPMQMLGSNLYWPLALPKHMERAWAGKCLHQKNRKIVINPCWWRKRKQQKTGPADDYHNFPETWTSPIPFYIFVRTPGCQLLPYCSCDVIRRKMRKIGIKKRKANGRMLEIDRPKLYQERWHSLGKKKTREAWEKQVALLVCTQDDLYLDAVYLLAVWCAVMPTLYKL